MFLQIIHKRNNITNINQNKKAKSLCLHLQESFKFKIILLTTYIKKLDEKGRQLKIVDKYYIIIIIIILSQIVLNF